MAKEMKSFNGYEIVDKTARDRIINPNILMNSSPKDFASSGNWTLSYINSTDGGYKITNDGIYFKSTSDRTNPIDSNGITIVITRTNSGLKTGDTVTFSADIKGKYVAGNAHMQYWSTTKTDSNFWSRRQLGPLLNNQLSETEFKRFSMVITLQDLYNCDDSNSDYFAIGGGYESEITFKNVKLEYGSVATKYTDYSVQKILGGSSTPSSSLGINGDLYVMF